MHPQLEQIFDEAEDRYLKPEELSLISQYVHSLPERIETYRRIRDQEVDIMQKVADQLELELSQEAVETLERCIRNALLVLRYCAMGVLLNDEAFVEQRISGWLSQTSAAYQTEAIDTTLYRLLNQRLNQALGATAMSLLNPMLAKAQNILLKPALISASANGR